MAINLEKVSESKGPNPLCQILENNFFQHNLRASGVKHRVVDSLHNKHPYCNKYGGATPQKNIFQHFKIWQRGVGPFGSVTFSMLIAIRKS